MKEERLQLIIHRKKRIIRNYYEQLYTKKFENVGEIDKFLEKYNLPKVNEEEEESLNRPITAGEIEAVIKKLPAHKTLEQRVSEENFTKQVKES